MENGNTRPISSHFSRRPALDHSSHEHPTGFRPSIGLLVLSWTPGISFSSDTPYPSPLKTSFPCFFPYFLLSLLCAFIQVSEMSWTSMLLDSVEFHHFSPTNGREREGFFLLIFKNAERENDEIRKTAMRLALLHALRKSTKEGISEIRGSAVSMSGS